MDDTLDNSYDTTNLNVSYAGSGVTYTATAETTSSTTSMRPTPYIELAAHETGHAVS
jgi:hypothetical protein